MPNQAKDQEELSLLWPSAAARGAARAALNPETARDIGLNTVVATLGGGHKQRKLLEQVFYHPTLDEGTIRYRQAVLDDLRRSPLLVEKLHSLLPTLEAMTFDYYSRESHESSTLFEVTWRLGELESITGLVAALHEVFTTLGDDIRSQGLQRLREAVQRMADDPLFQDLVAELPDLLHKVRASQSVTIGVNLDPHLQPLEATLLSVNDKRFGEAGFLSRLLTRDGEQWRGIAPLHSSEPADGGMMIGVAVPLPAPKHNPMMQQLFRDLAKVLNKVAEPVARALENYNEVSGRLFVSLYPDVVFYLAGVQLITRVSAAGLSMCRPQIAPRAERVCEVQENYNLALALTELIGHDQLDLRDKIVTNPIFLGTDGHIQILTGPNRGGKTTYLQAVGLTQVLAQTGLYVPGSTARISLVDGIYTHFPVEERIERGTGRFGDEAQRLKQIFAQATRDSLILLNETLTSTSYGESLYLAQDLLRVMRSLGVRAIFTTHMHELAEGLDTLNADTPGDSEICSIVASRIDEAQATGEREVARSFRIRPGPPMGKSFAQELAHRYGISREQLMESLEKRGALPADA